LITLLKRADLTGLDETEGGKKRERKEIRKKDF